MESIRDQISELSKSAIKNIFDIEIEEVEIQHTKEEFEGDYTLVVFPLLKWIKGNPQEIGEKIGQELLNYPEFSDFNVIKGFLNLELNNDYLLDRLQSIFDSEEVGTSHSKDKNYMVEYSSPNTNKPLHLGHIRNILLGSSVSNILAKAAYPTHTTQIVNDRGIHISKSMVAWVKFGAGETPESTGEKGDHFVGKYYVIFDKEYKKEMTQLVEQGMSEEEAKKEAPIFKEAQEMLRKWEENDPETIAIWKKMNGWVYEGFEETYERLDVRFDSIYYESNTYVLGKEIIADGLKKGVFYQKEDGSIWADLTEDGLDEKLVLRSDGTALYITQDIGTAVYRYNNEKIDSLVYTVGNEQDYHFKVLFLILKKLGYDWADNLHHLSYGMVTLPEGKMKSREGTVVDADDLLDEMHATAKETTEELGKINDFTEEEKGILFEQIGQAALKYFILKVDPKKSILFNPKESIEFQGNTGPFIQYTNARIQSLIRKAKEEKIMSAVCPIQLVPSEKTLIKLLDEFSETIEKSAQQLSPALVANYIYEVAKAYNSFYQENSVLNADADELKQTRMALSISTSNTLVEGLKLLGIQAPTRM